jgi:hypothetical protein
MVRRSIRPFFRSHAVRRSLFAGAILAALPLSVQARKTETTNETIIKLIVDPMPAPKPALRYSLLPDLRDVTPGNPIPNYLKCMMERDATGAESFGRAALRQADRAARMDRPDWQILLKLKSDGYNLLLPDVQIMRSLCTALQERCRAEVAEHRLDDALYTEQTMLAMARHMSEHPTLIGDLVGVAMATIAVGPLEEMLEQPGCPNLYWALTNLPSPPICFDKGMEGERVSERSELRDLDDAAPMSVGQLEKVVAHLEKLRREPEKPNGGVRRWLDARTRDEKHLNAARLRLVDSGLAPDLVAHFSADQVILLDERREHEVRRDDQLKLMKLPFWQIDEAMRKVKRRLAPCLLDFALPSLMKVRQAQSRLEQRVALLRHVEALRLHAAAHDGRLPEKLADVSVPLPDDPFTGKPFLYKLEGQTAHIRGSPPSGGEKISALNVHYIVTVRK